jgi:hypothetical protein
MLCVDWCAGLRGFSCVFSSRCLQWFESVIPPIIVPKSIDDWAFDVRHEMRGDKFLCNLDANALLDVFLSGWDTVVSRLFNNKVRNEM